jgi:hypothetical protein
MIASITPEGRTFMRRWLRLTWGGWILGVPMIALFALIGEALHVGGLQVFVGAGIGAGVGWMQARALRGIHPRPSRWFWASTAGMAGPFLVFDIARDFGWNYTYSLYVSVAFGGLVAGMWQELLLLPHFPRLRYWVTASTLGWSVGGLLAALADFMPRRPPFLGIVGLVVYLGIVAVGGLVLGAITGVVLARGLPDHI